MFFWIRKLLPHRHDWVAVSMIVWKPSEGAPALATISEVCDWCHAVRHNHLPFPLPPEWQERVSPASDAVNTLISSMKGWKPE
jgi:hypothetical protein